MFEHLVHKKHANSANRKLKIKLYLWFLVLAVFAFVSSWSWSQGSDTVANIQTDIVAKVFSRNLNDRATIVTQIPKTSVFDFVIETDHPKMFLSQLSITVMGADNQEWLSDLQLYHQDIQLGQITEIQGNVLFFNLDRYFLSSGENEFQLRLNNKSTLSLNDDVYFSIVNAQDIILGYDDHLLTPIGDWPVSSRKLSIINQGQLSSYNNLTKINFIKPLGSQQQLAAFSLSTIGEAMSIKDLVLDYSFQVDQKNVSEPEFYLIADGKTIAQTLADQNQITFSLSEVLILKNNQDLDLELWAELPQIGEYQFSLKEASGKGFISGQNLKLEKSLVLSQIRVLPAILYFDQQEAGTILSAGWHDLFKANISAQGQDQAKIHKLTWDLENYGLQIESVELLIDDQISSSKLSLRDDRIIADFSEEPLNVNQLELGLQLLVKVKPLTDQTRLQVILLSDQQEISEDNSQNNLLWSSDSQIYNGYLLPDFPLNPVILTN